MNRTLKFRAWITVDIDDDDNDIKEMTYDLAFTRHEPINDLLAKQEHIMQFTGLCDKNGKEIYEGDYIQWKNTRNYIVEWADDLSCFSLVENDEIRMAYGLYKEEAHLYTIIGNIYEHPHLLTPSK